MVDTMSKENTIRIICCGTGVVTGALSTAIILSKARYGKRRKAKNNQSQRNDRNGKTLLPKNGNATSKCNICSKEFQTKNGLNLHTKAKHPK